MGVEKANRTDELASDYLHPISEWGKILRARHFFFLSMFFTLITIQQISVDGWLILWVTEFQIFVFTDSKGYIFCYIHLASIRSRTFFFHFTWHSWQIACNFMLWLSSSYTCKAKQFPYTTGFLTSVWHTHFHFNYMSISSCSHVYFFLSVNMPIKFFFKKYLSKY